MTDPAPPALTIAPEPRGASSLPTAPARPSEEDTMTDAGLWLCVIVTVLALLWLALALIIAVGLGRMAKD